MISMTLRISAQNSKVPWWSFNMGYAESKTSNLIFRSVVGQSFVGTFSNRNSFIESGFLADTLFRSIFVDVKDEFQLPSVFELYQNYPNPFNPATTIKYDLPTSQRVTIKLYNLLGQEVRTLVDEDQEPGYKSVRVNAINLASGVYLYRVNAGKFSMVKKMIMVK